MLLGLARPAEKIEDYQGYIHFALIAATEARVEVRSGNVGEAIAALAVCQRLRPLLTRAIPWYAVQTLVEMAEDLLRPRGSQRCARRTPGRSRDPPPPPRPRHPRATCATTSGAVGVPRRWPLRMGVVADNRGAAAPPAAHDPPRLWRDRGTARCLLQHREDTDEVDLQEARCVVPERRGCSAPPSSGCSRLHLSEQIRQSRVVPRRS